MPRALPRIAIALALLVLPVMLALQGRRTRRSRLARREERWAHALLAPWAVGFALFLLAPAALSLLLSFGEWSPLRSLGDVRWAGGENYARLVSDPTFHASLGATATYALLSVPLGLGLALALALLLRRETASTSLVRTACYLPALVSPVIAGALARAARGERAHQRRPPRWDRVRPGCEPARSCRPSCSSRVEHRSPDAGLPRALQALDPSLEEAARTTGPRRGASGTWCCRSSGRSC
jgi:ABC-type spermidine/putrescine transport system permease subunit II